LLRKSSVTFAERKATIGQLILERSLPLLICTLKAALSHGAEMNVHPAELQQIYASLTDRHQNENGFREEFPEAARF